MVNLGLGYSCGCYDVQDGVVYQLLVICKFEGWVGGDGEGVFYLMMEFCFVGGGGGRLVGRYQYEVVDIFDCDEWCQFGMDEKW